MKLRYLLIAGLVAFCLAYSTKAIAQKSPIEKTWYDQKKSCKVKIYKGADGKFYGTTVWLREPNDKTTGKPRVDKENPNEKMRNNPIVGITLLSNFEQDPNDKNVFVNGNVYNPDNGKMYCAKITFKDGKMDMRGYLCSLPFLGRTEEWSMAEAQ